MKTILIAEDTDSNFMLLEIILRKKFNLIRAYDGQQALEMLANEKPDLILMDLKMPVMDGLTATREIRNNNTEIPIIALTANVFDSDREKSIEAGCNEYIPKPVIAPELLALIDKYI